MSVLFELEVEVQPPPPVTQTEAIRVPPGDFGKPPTAMGGDGIKLYKYELTKAIGGEDKRLSKEELIETVPIAHRYVDTITPRSVIPWQRIIVEDTI